MVAVNKQQMMDSLVNDAGQLEIPVDAEHGGIRMAGCLTFLAALVIGFFAVNMVTSAPGLAAVLALVIASASTYVVDMILKRSWPSGRVLVADEEAIKITRNGKIESVVDPQKQVNVMLWRFEVSRTGRVKKGWYVVSCTLEQDESHLPVYSFCSPDDFEDLPLANSFSVLERRRKDADKSSEREMRLAGQQRRLQDAERYRGENGAEMTLDEFRHYLTFLQENYGKWMPQR